jgi:hypothetical protein
MGNDLVDRATSDTLISPHWTLNLEICDIINQDTRQAKDVVKALKKRISHRNPKVQMLALSLLESLLKNCGDFFHAYVAEKDILKEMVKVAKKKPDGRVKQKILSLIDIWQEAFGGPLGKFPKYYKAYQDLLVSFFLNEQRALERFSHLHRHNPYKTTLHLCVQSIVTGNPRLLLPFQTRP